jgi:hypothetical protein
MKTTRHGYQPAHIKSIQLFRSIHREHDWLIILMNMSCAAIVRKLS